ncbi:BRCT domain-containing protein [Pseudozyma hubeiensis]|nr:BRCT domain-containing protein [Pseudozyma hubeiensis]
MNASQENDEFIEPAARLPRQTESAAASTSAHTLAAVEEPRVELASNETDDARASTSDAQGQANSSNLDARQNVQADALNVERTPSSISSSVKIKVFLKSSSPDVPLHVFLPRELSHTLLKKLQITIKAHGGVMESRLGKADLIVVDPNLKGVSKRTLREADSIGQPIPVVIPDYVYDCAAQGQQLDLGDPKYKYNPSLQGPDPPQVPEPAPRTLNGRNPFTESDRQAIVSYFVDKHESSWSLNAAARELAIRIPTHTYQSFQSYLQANFDKGWNLKQKVIVARREALEGEPSELQARIFRSQYTASPGLHEQSEQSAPSDGWPRTSPAPQSNQEPAAESDPNPAAENGHGRLPAHQVSSQSEDDDQDLLVRQPNPGTEADNVDKSPTKTKQPVERTSSEESDPDTSPPASLSLGQIPPHRSQIQASPSPDEEPDPEHYSPRILTQIERAEKSRPQSSQKANKKPHRRSQSSSDYDSELDELDHDSDQDLVATGSPSRVTAQADRIQAADSEDSEWEGSKRIDRKLRMGTGTDDNRVKFLQDEKDDLMRKLVEHVLAHGDDLPPSTQNAMLNQPQDSFWTQFASTHPRHSAASWRSHYRKNRAVYRRIVDMMILDRRAGEESGQADDSSDVESQDQLASNPQPSASKDALAKHDALESDTAAAQRTVEQLRSGSEDSLSSNDISFPDDGIVVMIPLHSTERPPARRSSHGDQWPDEPPPPPIEDEDEDMLQVEDQVNALAETALSVEDREESPPSPSSSDGGRSGTGTDPKSPTKSPVPSDSAAMQVARSRSTSAVEAGTPVLAQHRDAAFYDFTMDSDEEQRIRKARSRPSLPNMQRRQRDVSPRMPAAPITTDRVLGHFATPSRGQQTKSIRNVSLSVRQAHKDSMARTREWTRSISSASSSGSGDRPPRPETIAVTESSRSRASRIDRRPLLAEAFVGVGSPSRVRNTSQPLFRRPMSGVGLPSAPVASSPTPARVRPEPMESDFEAARRQYRADAERFREDYGLNREQRNNLLKRFDGNIKQARQYIADWLADVQDAYDVEASVAFEYVKTSQGDFAQAENFLRLAAMTRSSSTPNRSVGASSRGDVRSVSPVKRSTRVTDRSPARPERAFGRGESSKRFRR